MTELLSTAAAASIIGVTSATLISYAQTGKVRASFIARKWRFRHEDLEAFIASQRRSR